MRKFLWTLGSSALLGLLAAGCSQHSIKSGIWELSIRVERHENREPLPIPKREVRIEVAWEKNEAKPDVTEIAEISALEAPGGDGAKEGPRLVRKPMYADIERREERDTLIRVRHRDEDWIWQMDGVVQDSENILGTRFNARPHMVSTASFEGAVGSWSMKWLRDG